MQSGENILQNWKITIGNQNPIYPFVVVDNWYTPNEEKNVWKELDFFSATPKNKIERAENTIVARNKDGSSKSKAYRFYVEDYYKKREISPILNCLYKQRSPEFKEILEQKTFTYPFVPTVVPLDIKFIPSSLVMSLCINLCFWPSALKSSE